MEILGCALSINPKRESMLAITYEREHTMGTMFKMYDHVNPCCITNNLYDSAMFSILMDDMVTSYKFHYTPNWLIRLAIRHC